jgi:hypothetical protein
MTAENKKILLYSGAALVVGSVAYFIYDFFSKPKMVNLGKNSVKLGEDVKTDSTSGQFVAQDLGGGIKAPNIIETAIGSIKK